MEFWKIEKNLQFDRFLVGIKRQNTFSNRLGRWMCIEFHWLAKCMSRDFSILFQIVLLDGKFIFRKCMVRVYVKLSITTLIVIMIALLIKFWSVNMTQKSIHWWSHQSWIHTVSWRNIFQLREMTIDWKKGGKKVWLNWEAHWMTKTTFNWKRWKFGGKMGFHNLI